MGSLADTISKATSNKGMNSNIHEVEAMALATVHLEEGCIINNSPWATNSAVVTVRLLVRDCVPVSWGCAPVVAAWIFCSRLLHRAKFKRRLNISCRKWEKELDGRFLSCHVLDYGS